MSGRFEPVGLPELAAALSPREIAVDLLSLDAGDGLVVTCFDDAAEPVLDTFGSKPESRRRLLRRLRRVRRELQAEIVVGEPDDVDAARSEMAAAYRALDDELLIPIAETIRKVAEDRTGLSLIISPENDLLQVPFSRLTFHLKDVRVSIIPTIAGLALVRRRRSPAADHW